MKDWRTYERHPISARYPDIRGRAWEDFLANLSKRKVRSRLITLHEGKILDGWQLQRACVIHNIEPKYQTLREGEDPEAFVAEANEYRRHESAEAIDLRREQRRESEAELRRQGKSFREIADIEGISERTVRTDLAKAGAGGVAPEPPDCKITGQDGKSYSPRGRTKKPPRKPKSGSILFDWKAFDEKYGVLLRTVDQFGNAYACKESPAAEGLRRKLTEWRKEFKQWAEFKMKRILP